MGFHAARWLGGRLFGAAGFNQLGSDFADARIARVREKLGRGETVYLAGIGPPGTHNSGVALVEVSQANGPRLISTMRKNAFPATSTRPNILLRRSMRWLRRCAASAAISGISTRG